MIYGYARVSSRGQAIDGNSLEYQEKILKENGATIIYKEIFTGTTKNRPKLNKLINKANKGDTVIFTKLDRLARSAIEGLNIVNALFDKGVTINILGMGIMDDTPMGKATRTMFFCFAEFERDMITSRLYEGKEVAKRKNPNYKEGRTPIAKEKIVKVKKLIDNGYSVTQACKDIGISRGTWYKYK